MSEFKLWMPGEDTITPPVVEKRATSALSILEPALDEFKKRKMMNNHSRSAMRYRAQVLVGGDYDHYLCREAMGALAYVPYCEGDEELYNSACELAEMAVGRLITTLPEKPVISPKPEREFVKIRWMINRDIKQMVDIEKRCFEFPWSAQDFERESKRRDCVALVAEGRTPTAEEIELASFYRSLDPIKDKGREENYRIEKEKLNYFDGRVVGYLIYNIHKHSLSIVNIAVHPELSRQEIGEEIVLYLYKKMSQQRRRILEVIIRESNLPAQQFVSATGFDLTGILREFYEDTDEDAFLFHNKLVTNPESTNEQQGLYPYKTYNQRPRDEILENINELRHVLAL